MSGTQPAAAVAVGNVLLFVVCPLIVIAVAGMVGWAIMVNKRLSTQDTALALIIQQVSPPGQMTLRDMVIGIGARTPPRRVN